jgi:hypothetical protein
VVVGCSGKDWWLDEGDGWRGLKDNVAVTRKRTCFGLFASLTDSLYSTVE